MVHQTRESLPERSWAIMVHKIYEERVVEYLMGHHDNSTDDAIARSKVTTLGTFEEAKGPSRGRRGYRILLCCGVQKLPTEHLSPLARQNISWTARMQYKVPILHPSITGFTTHNNPSDNCNNYDDVKGTLLVETLAASLYSTLRLAFNLTTDALRIDVYPRHYIEPLCGHLQKQAKVCTRTAGLGTNINNNSQTVNDEEVGDPFEGPIRMTASRSQCTVRLSVVIGQQEEQQQQEQTNTGFCTTTCYWGIDRRPDENTAIDLRLNHEANEELNIVAMVPENGHDPPVSSDNKIAIHPTTPLSRAHYKLLQVWHDIIQPREDELRLYTGAALDLGASPGGWTQVLIHNIHCATVYALDPAIIAHRVLHHHHHHHQQPAANLAPGSTRPTPVVKHIPCMMDRFEQNAAAHLTMPLSTLVCDASVLWSELWQTLLLHILPHVPKWQFPAVLVLTCKLPFRTAGSIARHVAMMNDQVPAFLESMRPHFGIDRDMVSIESQFLHLFANSESERTLLLVVTEKET
eukprot:scaffold14530_cov217-Amphora_coffeaeformis.AAC.2